MSDPKDLALIEQMAGDSAVQQLSNRLLTEACRYRYPYNFTWMGRPVIQFPPDMLATQEIIWKIRPELIIETGVAHGGSLIFSASILELLGGNGRVIGIDIDIRSHNRAAIEGHLMSKRIELVQGSSIDPKLVADVTARASGHAPVMVILDSNHTHDHVLREMEMYSPLVKKGAYLIVQDTVVEDMPADLSANRPWGPGNNPKTAVHAFLKNNDRFVIDAEYDQKLLMTGCHNGYLQCTKG